MVFLKFSPYFIISSFLTTLLLDRGVCVAGNTQFLASSPWYPKANPSKVAKISKDETEALKKVLPLVTFDCLGKTGYFPDSKFNCEVFHYCQPDGGRSTFHCPNRQLFNQLSMICEGKTAHNSKLCKEGSINPSTLQKIPKTKKLNSSENMSPIMKPSLNSSNSKDKKLMTLEDLLTYMNSEQGGKETEPTFISRFHKAGEPQKSTKLPESAIIKPKKEIRPVSDKKPSKSINVQLKAESSDQSFKITKSSPTSKDNSNKDVQEDEVSAEYDAIEGRKYRKHKRVGRVLDIETERQPKNETRNKDKKPHSHMTERSVSEPPQHQESTTSSSTSDADTRNSSSPSLFATDRNKARDIRKRKRYQGRKRKTTTLPDVVMETEPSDLAESATTVIPTAPTVRQDLDTARNNAHKRRKSQRTRTRSDVHKIYKSEKIEPYTLPPLPTLEDDIQETTTQSIQKEETKNPWYKPTTPPPDESAKFGEKISDLNLHHYPTGVKLAAEHLAADFFGAKNNPGTSEELLSEEYRERLTMQSTHSHPGDSRSHHKSKIKSLKKYNEDDGYIHYESPPVKQHMLEPVNMFPPPRAEPREHHSTPPQQMMFDYDSHKPKSHSFQKATTEDPFKVTHSYQDKYQIETQEPNNQEDERWKTSSDNVKSDEKKVEVGSTFFFQNPISPEITKHPKLQETSPTESDDLKSGHKEKEMLKHTLAQQHLSKIMNDFFAMSSPKLPGRLQLDSDKEEDMIVPEYRIPDEDIYTGSESIAEDVGEIPPELLEVVDLITGNAESKKNNLKPRTSHEIIKINGPITNSEIEKIFLDDKFDEEPNQRPSSDGSFKKIVVIPRPEDKEDSRDVEEAEEVTSLKLEQFLKQYTDRKPLKSLKVISLKPEPQIKRQPTILRAKKVPVRVIYRDQLAETLQPKPTNQKPNIKVIRTQITSPRMKISSDGKRQARRPITHTFSSYSQPQIVLHPSSLFPPHPPPLPKKQYPLNVGYPFASSSRLHVQHIRQGRSRRKRSIVSRLRRQIRQNQYFLPFSSPVYPSFNPKFVPTFSPFKPLFNPASLHTSGSHLSPFAFPGYPVPRPPQTRPNSFRPSHQRPPHVRHVSPTGHQTVIVEEVPVPVPVEVPNANFLQPASSGSPPSKLPPRYPDNQFRNPSPPAMQTPPLIQRPQHRFPPPPNNYRPFGMPSNVRPPPPVTPPYRSPIPLTGPLPPRITSEGQVFALGVTNKPILTAPDPRPARPPSGGPNLPPRNLPGPYNPFSIHANSYPNFPYFQGAFTTPISNEPLAGRIMYSGYKPPKSTAGTRPPKPPTKNKDRKASESNSNRSRTKLTQDYFEAPPRPMRESHVSYTEEVLSKGRPRERPNFQEYSTENKDIKFSRQNSNNSPSSNEVPRKRKPGRRRRPRPYTTTQGSSISNDISPTPPPPEQIPPPPAEYTSKPSHHEVLSSLPSSSEGTRVHETSSHFPPAGYYGKDQLVQFFDSSSKSSEKPDNPKSRHKNFGESRSNIESDDSASSTSFEDGNEPVFGTRLRSNPSTESRNRQSKNKQPPRLQTQKSEIRTRPTIKQSDIIEEKRKEVKPMNEGNNPQTQIRNERPPPRRRRPHPPRDRSHPPPPRDRSHPPPPRDRSHPPPMMRPQSKVRPQPEAHHFNYNENMGNFYSVPKGLQNFVAPSANPQQGFRGSTDMFGLPHPVIDQGIYSLRPQGAPDFDPNFFSVPAHVTQQQQSPLHKMNVRPVPESVRDFFTAPEAGSIPSEENSESDKKESESRHTPSKSKGENDEQSESPARKLRKPKRKNRYNPHSTEVRDSSEANSIKPQGDPRDGSTVRYREKPTTSTTTTVEPRSTTTTNYQRPITTTNYHSQNDIKESQNAFKQRSPLLPKALPELSKSLMNGKIDFQKLNSSISTSVSISGAIPQTNNTSSEEKENKRVFSSQNGGGGLAVVRKGPKRKRARQRVSSTTGVPYVNNETNADAKYEIAASVLDIIKATTETERQGSVHYDNFQSERPSSSRVSNIWVESPSKNKYQR